MTDLLIRDPNDTGDIPPARTEPGQTTERLNPYLIPTGPFPVVLRRSNAENGGEGGSVTGGCRTVDPNDDDFESPDELQGPQPKPRPLPKPTPKVDDRPLSPGEEVSWTSTWRPAGRTPGYVGRHRKVSRWDRVRVALAIAWAPIRGAF